MPLRPAQNPASNTSLKGTVHRIGVRPTVSRTQRAAAVADLRLILEGGKTGSRVKATFTVTLNTSIGGSGTARLADETNGSASEPGTKRGNAYVFEDVQFPAPGPAAARVFRITNIRANISGLSGGAASIPPVVASVAVISSTPIILSSAEQTVAVLARSRAAVPRSRLKSAR